MSGDDAIYFRRRAEQELELAQRANDRAVVSAHYRLSEAYLKKLEAPIQVGADDGGPCAPEKPLFDFAQDSGSL